MVEVIAIEAVALPLLVGATIWWVTLIWLRRAEAGVFRDRCGVEAQRFGAATFATARPVRGSLERRSL